jgi:hypothetical protein
MVLRHSGSSGSSGALDSGPTRVGSWILLRRMTAAVFVAAVLSGCGDDGRKTTAEDIKASTTTVDRSVADQPDACAVFTQSEVASFVGNDISPGTDTGAGQGCYFAALNNGTAMLVNLQTGDSAAKFADAKSNAGEQTQVLQMVPDVGDEAFVYAPRSGELASAEARKGSVRVRIVITGPAATIEMARKALLSAVLRAPSK